MRAVEALAIKAKNWVAEVESGCDERWRDIVAAEDAEGSTTSLGIVDAVLCVLSRR